jgi:hypothetical protein
MWHYKLKSSNHCEADYDAIETAAGHVIVKHYQTCTLYPCQIVGQGLQMNRVDSLVEWSRAMVLLSKAVVIFALINHSFPQSSFKLKL